MQKGEALKEIDSSFVVNVYAVTTMIRVVYANRRQFFTQTDGNSFADRNSCCFMLQTLTSLLLQMEMCKHGRLSNGFSWLTTEHKAIDQYRHRAGRTARSLQKGVSVTLLTPDEESIARTYVTKLNIGQANLRITDASKKDEIKLFLQEAQI